MPRMAQGLFWYQYKNICLRGHFIRFSSLVIIFQNREKEPIPLFLVDTCNINVSIVMFQITHYA